MDNFFVLMEWNLIPKPDFHDMEKVKAAVETRKRILKQKATGSKKAKNERAVKSLTEFMQDISLEKLECAYQEAYQDAVESIKDELKYVAPTGELSVDKAQNIAKKNNVSSEFLYETFNLVRPQEKQVKKIKIPKCSNKIGGDIQDKLLLLNKKDLYDYLCKDMNDERSRVRLLSSAQLIERAKALYGQFDRDTDLNRKTAGQNLSTLCQEVFKDELSKKDYDYYLEIYLPVNAILKKVAVLAEDDGKVKTLRPEVGEAMVSEINEIIRNIEESRAYLRGKCEEIKVTWIESGDSSIANCVFCGKRIGIEDEICGHCGKKQHIECPKCKKKVLANSRFCTSCGNKFGDAIKVSEYCNAALQEIRNLNFSAARYYLDMAVQEGIETDDLSAARKKLQTEEKNVGSSIELLEESQKNGLYYKASQILNEIRTKYPSYKNDTLEIICNDAISKAKGLFQKAVAASKEAECLEICTKIEQICRDYPGIRDLKEKFPPEVPNNVQVRTDDKKRMNTISWEYSGLMTGVEFIVLRKENVKPVNIQDGEKIGKHSSTSCIDKAPEAGKNYYYAVFACRGNKISNPGVTLAPTINIFDVSGLNITSDNGVVKLSWDPVKEGTIKIWRKENGMFPQKAGDGVEITNVSESGVWDGSVKNGVVYGYIVCIEYMTERGSVYSTGVKARGTPEVPPQAVTYLLARQDEKNNQIFHMEWDDDITDTIKFYGSADELKWSEGTSVAMEEIERAATELKLSKKEVGKGILDIGANGKIYVTAVTVGKASGLIGANVFVSNHKIFEILETKLVHGDIDITINSWPAECSALKVLYRLDQYPTGYSDKEAESFICTRATFKATNSVVIKQINTGNYYISIYGVYQGSKGYSPAVRTKYVNQEKQILCYSIKAKKSLFGKIADVTLTLFCERPVMIPEMIVVKNNGYLPPNSLVGEKILEIPTGRDERKSFEFHLGNTFQKNDYIRLFLKNPKDAAMFELNAVSDLNI